MISLSLVGLGATTDARPSTIICTSAAPSTSSKHNTGMVYWTSSDSPTSSVGVMVQVILKNIMVQLEHDCGGSVMDIFAVGRRTAVFAQAHQKYSAWVTQLDANICSYLKVW